MSVESEQIRIDTIIWGMAGNPVTLKQISNAIGRKVDKNYVTTRLTMYAMSNNGMKYLPELVGNIVLNSSGNVKKKPYIKADGKGSLCIPSHRTNGKVKTNDKYSVQEVYHDGRVCFLLSPYTK